jgi:hypothetical protein
MMEDRHEAYLADLRARHERDREALRRALAGRRPRALRAIERRQHEVEAETARILEFVGGRGA